MSAHFSIGRMRDTVTVLAASLAVLAAVTVTAGAQNTGYALARQIPLPGDGGWDYLEFDPAGHGLFITHGTHVIVIDPKTGALLGDITGTPHVHGIALAPDLGRGFISAAGDSAIHIFDLKTLKQIGTAKADPDDDAMLYDPKTHYAVSMNGDAGTATVVAGATGEVVGTVKLPGKPEFAVTDGRGTVYANMEDKSLLVAIDLASLKVVRQWPLAPCESPSGLAIDVPHHRLFSGCHNKVMAISHADAWKAHYHGADRGTRRCQSLRRRNGQRLQLERRWHAHGRPRGLARQVHGVGIGPDAPRRPHDGARSRHAHDLPRDREVRARRRQ